MTRWQADPDVRRGADYDARWAAMAAAGENPHGEADFVGSLNPASVLDAGCGTGRVAIELARRGLEVCGVDVDQQMLATARDKAPGLQWVQADLSTLDLGRRFDVVVLAGNVLIFVQPGTESAVLARCAAHLAPGGALVTGFQLRADGYGVDDLDIHAAAAGLVLRERFATWDAEPFSTGGDYAVSVHRPRDRPAGDAARS